MKKVIMAVLLLLGIACAGAGYYIFYYKPQQDALALEQAQSQTQQEPEVKLVIVEDEPQPPPPPQTDYYVNPDKLGVRESPDYDAFIESVVYRGDKLHIHEKKDGWGRISAYFVYEDGGPEVAEWVPMEALLEVPPTITRKERMSTLSEYIEESDDFKQHFEMFISTTDQLIKDGTCTPLDFEETKGWIRSVTFSEQEAYFVYCGGLKQANKIYLNIRTGKIFYR